MSELHWEDPPNLPNTRKGTKSKVFTQEVEDALHANPGKWLRVIEFASKTHVANSYTWANRRGGYYECTSRTIPGREEGTKTPYSVYVRYLGKN